MTQAIGQLDKKRTRRFIKKYCFAIMFFILFLMVLAAKTVNTVNAVTPGNNEMIRTEIDNVLNGLFVINVKYMQEAYMNFADLAGPANGSASVLGTLVSRLNGIIMIFAIFLCMIFSMIGVIKESQRGEITMDYWTKIFISSVVAVFMVVSAHSITTSLYNAGGAIIESFVSATVAFAEEGTQRKTSITDEEKQKLLQLLSKYPPFNGYAESAGTGTEEDTEETTTPADPDEEKGEVTIGTLEDIYYGTTDAYYASQYIHELMTPMQLLSLLPMLASMYLMYSMIFELKLREMFAPVAVATVGYEGARSTGVRFLKKYLACFIRIALYFVIAAMGYALTQHFYAETLKIAMTAGNDKEITVSAVTSIILMFGSNALAALTMMQSGALADEIVGA